MKLVTYRDVKKILLSIGIIFLPAINSIASENRPHVTVYGTATTSVAIDEMNWRIRVSNKDTTLEEVAKAHNSTVQSVLDFLMDNELPEHCIQSSGMEFGENFVTSKLKGRVRSGYQASSSIKFKVTDLSKYKDLCIPLDNLSIKECLPIIKNCNLSICNDSSFSHLSAALGVKTITLMADTPIVYGNYSSMMFPIIPEGEEIVSHNTLGKEKISSEKIFNKVIEILN